MGPRRLFRAFAIRILGFVSDFVLQVSDFEDARSVRASCELRH
jgi:hypothetical protein